MKRVIGILLSIVLIVALLPVMPMRADEVGTSYVSIDPTTGEKSNAHQVCEPLASNATSWGSADQTTWYAVDGSVTITDRITVLGDVHLILRDECILTAEKGITVADNDNDPDGSPNSLTIYGQPEGSGKLIATSETDSINHSAAIGGLVYDGSTPTRSCGTITINGGIVKATTNGTTNNGAAIGGGMNGNGGTITINGGTVKATSDGTTNNGAAIGGGSGGNGGNITINGGVVTATATSENGSCSSNGAGIGGGSGRNGGNITINGGEIKATASATSENGSCSSNGAGIGGGANGENGGSITINGGEIKATATASATSENWDCSSNGAGIGGGYIGDGGIITINGGGITATASATSNGRCSSNGAGIGGGKYRNGGTIIINGGNVEATCTATSSGSGPVSSNGAGIGGGNRGSGGNITINGGIVAASVGDSDDGVDADSKAEGIGRGTTGYGVTNVSGTLTLGEDVVLYGSNESVDVLLNDNNIIDANTITTPPSYERKRYMKAITYIKTVKLTLTKPSIGTTITMTDDGQGESVQQPKPDVSLEENANYTINKKLWYDTLPTDQTQPEPMTGTIQAGKYYVQVYLVPNIGYSFERFSLPELYLNGTKVDVPYGLPGGIEGCNIYIPVTITAPPVEPPVEQTAPPVEQYCTITYDSNGGTGSMEAQKVKKGSQISVDDCGFEKKGYEFVSWNTQQDGTGTSYNVGQLLYLNSNLYLYAQWKKLSIVDAKINLNQKSKSCKYDGKAHKIKVTSVVLNGKMLIPGTDYMAPNVVNAREAKEYEIVVTGIGDYAGEKIIKYIVLKGDNTLITADANRTARCKVNASTKKTSDSVKVSGVKIKNIGQGKITFKKVSVNKDAGKFKVDKNTGKITVRNRTKIGTYKVTVSAKAAGNNNYKSTSQKRVVMITLKSKYK